MENIENWKSHIRYLNENNGELEVEIELTNGKEKRFYFGFLSEK